MLRNRRRVRFLESCASAAWRLARVLLVLAMVVVGGGLTAAAAGPSRPAAQATSVTGTVTDAAGKPVAGALVTIHDAASGAQTHRTTTGADGRFAVTVESPSHLIVVTSPGFSPSTLTTDGATRFPVAIVLEPVTTTRGVVEVGGRLVATGESVTVEAREDYRTMSSSVATKTDTPLLEVPMNVSVTDRAQLDDMAAINIAKSHDYTVGFTSNGESGLADSRGFAVSWYDHRRDGLRTYAFSIREPAAVDRIQYLRGPSAVLYGDGSPGGLVNLVLKKPLPVAYREVTVSTGTLGLRRATFDITGPLNRSTSLVGRAIVAAEGFDAGNDNDEVRLTLLPTVTYSLSPVTSLTFDAEYYYEGGRGYTIQQLPATSTAIATGDLATIPFGFNVASPDDRWHNWSFSPGVRLDTKWRLAEVHTAFRYTRVLEVADQHWLDGLDEDDRTALRSLGSSRYDWGEYQSDTFVTWPWQTGNVRHQFVAGLEMGLSTTDGYWGSMPSSSIDIYDPVYESRPSDPVETVPYIDQTFRAGAYIQDQLSRGPWHVVGALRWSRVSTESEQHWTETPLIAEHADHEWSPRVGLVYQPRPDYSLYLSASSAFEPAYPGSLLEDGSPVTPTRSRDFEGGLKANLFNGRATLSSAVFRLDRRDVAEWQADCDCYRQIGRAESHGVEIELVGQVTRGLSLRPGYAYTRTRVLEDVAGYVGTELQRTPHHKFNLWGAYQLPGRARRVSVQAGIIRVGTRFVDAANEIEVPAYVRVDAGASLDLTHDWTAQLAIDNLTNVRYIVGGWDSSWEAGIRRRSSLVLKKRF